MTGGTVFGGPDRVFAGGGARLNRARGLVGKDEASPYVEGRTLSWLKVKVPRFREGERGWDPKR